MELNRLDLPAPLGPMMALMLPSGTSSDTSSSTVRPPKPRLQAAHFEQVAVWCVTGARVGQRRGPFGVIGDGCGHRSGDIN